MTASSKPRPLSTAALVDTLIEVTYEVSCRASAHGGPCFDIEAIFFFRNDEF
jgi:hypothetical protein